MKLDKIEKFICDIDEHKGGKLCLMYFLIWVVNDAKKSLNKLKIPHRIVAIIFYSVEVMTLLAITILTIDDFQMTREILYLFGLFIFVSICHILFYKKYLNNSEVKD